MKEFFKCEDENCEKDCTHNVCWQGGSSPLRYCKEHAMGIVSYLNRVGEIAYFKEIKLQMKVEMTNYIKDAIKTESRDFVSILDRLDSLYKLRVLHATMGLSTEAGELLDAMKKYIFYGKSLDIVNLQEELGDIFWYAAILADACQFTFEDTMEKNIAKLKARYPNKFTEKDAVIRNLDEERRILEGEKKHAINL